MNKPIHILYINNDNSTVASTKSYLRNKGYAVDFSNGNQACLDNISNTSFDILILDYPYPNSLGILKELSIQNLLYQSIIIIEDDSDLIIPDATHCGCTHFLARGEGGNGFFNLLVTNINNVIDHLEKNQIAKELQYCVQTAERVQSTSKVGNWQYYPGSNIAEWSHQEFLNFGFTPDSISPTYDKYIDAIHPDDKALVEKFNIDCMVNRVPTEFVFRLLLDDGNTRYIRAITEVDIDQNNDVIRVFGVSQDITEQKLVEASLKQAATVYETTTEAIFVTDENNIIRSTNAAFTIITGFTEEQALGKTPNILASGYHDEHFFHKFRLELKQQGSWQGEVWNRHTDGHIYPTWQSITAINDPQGNIIQYVSIFNDISTRKAQEELIRFQANYDSLTELPNRNLFNDRMELAINQAKRSKKRIALMFLDLDRFKWINDTWGHRAGDLLLMEVAKRLNSIVRSSDTVARMGGDEFTLILPELEKAIDAEIIAKKIFSTFVKPVDIEGNEIVISASIGISIYPDDGSDSQTLQKHSDHAMYSAKESGRNRYHYYTPLIQAESERRIILLHHLRRAIDHNEFSVAYQPIIDITNHQIVSAEALIRWTQSALGSVSPVEFIPIAEEASLIGSIGDWVVKRVAQDMQHWQQMGLNPIHISINKSPKQFSIGTCDKEWDSVFTNHGIPLSQITVEITESVFMDKERHCIDTLTKMQEMGMQISLDDFGTGYSSLSYLKRFPVEILKIDREFINDLTTDPSDALLVETILSLAEKMNIKVIAEGVETEQQLNFLKQHHCRYAQGYYFSKPLPIDEFELYLETHQSEWGSN
ncbi:MAG: EAL domain-containing protein [Methylococcaceae bacterium]